MGSAVDADEGTALRGAGEDSEAEEEMTVRRGVAEDSEAEEEMTVS